MSLKDARRIVSGSCKLFTIDEGWLALCRFLSFDRPEAYVTRVKCNGSNMYYQIAKNEKRWIVEYGPLVDTSHPDWDFVEYGPLHAGWDFTSIDEIVRFLRIRHERVLSVKTGFYTTCSYLVGSFFHSTLRINFDGLYVDDSIYHARDEWMPISHTPLFKELMERAWHPSRMVDWCLPHDERAEVTSWTSSRAGSP